MVHSATPARLRAFLQGLCLAVLALVVYWPSLHGGFILDDDVFLTRNPLIRAADGLGRLWFTRESADYWPLASSTLWIEWRLWGMNPLGYHAVNLALHVGSALLLWRILQRMEIPGAWLAAAIFAVHPLNVESVAWITQRKNTLAMLFFLLAIYAFVRAEIAAPPRPAAGGGDDSATHSGGWRGCSLALFVLALLSKGSVVPLPAVLLGLILWRRRPAARDLLRLLPFFAVAAVFAGVNVWFQTHGGEGLIREAGLLERFLGACAIPWFYLGKLLLPVRLAFVYPQWHVDPSAWQWWLSPLALAALAVILFRQWHGCLRGVVFGLGYFGVMLIPVSGLAPIRFMRFSVVADHYAHLAMIGVVVPLCALWVNAWSHGGWAAVVGRATALAAVLALAVLGWRQCQLYRDAETLYTATLRLNPNRALLHNNLGVAWQDDGQPGAARVEYETALRLQPDYPEAENNLGALLSAQGQLPEAAAHFAAALRLRPSFADAADNLGALRARQGRPREAMEYFTRAIVADPSFALAHYNRAGGWEALGHSREALAEMRAAVRLDPDFAAAHNSLGGLLYTMGRTAEATAEVCEAIRLKPNYAAAHANLALILQSEGRLEEAAAEQKLVRPGDR